MQSVRTEPLTFVPARQRGRVPGALRWARSYPLGTISIIILIALLVLSFAGPEVFHWKSNAVGHAKRLLTPSGAHLMGTDDLGRDELSRIAYGGRISLTVGVGAVVIGTLLGGVLGLVSGFFGRSVDFLLQRLLEVLQAVPGLIVVLLMVAVVGRSSTVVMVTLGVLLIPIDARTMRSAVLSTREAPFVEATQSVGASQWRLALRHILPHAITPVLVVASFSVGTAIIAEATLSFLGAGVQPPTPSWGRMLSDAMLHPLSVKWWLVLMPAAAVALTVIAVNFLGDALRDTLDPRLSK